MKCILMIVLSALCYALRVEAQSPGPLLPYPDGLIFEHTYLPNMTYGKGGDLFRQLFQVEYYGEARYQLDPAETFEETDSAEIKKFEGELAGLSGSFQVNRFYTAFRIYHGLKRSNGRMKQIFIYAPIIMKWSKSFPAQNSTMDVFDPVPAKGDVHEYDRLYTLENKVFVRVPQDKIDTAKSWIDNYRNFIRIDENNTGNFRTYDSTQDALSEVFAFRELAHFFDTCKHLYITSYANTGMMYGYTTFKHFIAFSNNKYTEVEQGSTIAADLGTMCPPNCMAQMIHAGRIQAVVDEINKLYNSGSPLWVGAGTPKRNDPACPDRKIIWILVIIGSVLTGFIASRLLKK